MMGFVYAVECGQRIKIGFSNQPELRFSKIASDAPFPCRLLGYWRGSRADEIAVHRKFSELRVHGEWFASTETLLDFITGMRVDTPPMRSSAQPVEFCGVLVPRGTKSRLAEALNITPGAIAQWKQVPPDRAIDVERVTGISRHLLRPDVFGAVPGRAA
ncbi:Cro/CI family transcriptional regulator [Mesorhizobium sp. A556]